MDDCIRSENADMSNDKSCVNHDRRKFKGFCEPVVDADRIGALHGRTRVPWMENLVVTRARRVNAVNWITSCAGSLQEKHQTFSFHEEKPPYPNPTQVNRWKPLRRMRYPRWRNSANSSSNFGRMDAPKGAAVKRGWQLFSKNTRLC